MSRALGDIAEERASAFLRADNYQIIERNFYTKHGEIDIIALRDEVLHFIEVKSAKVYELAVQNMTPKKLERVLYSCEVYLQKHKIQLDYVVDVIIVTPDAIKHIENITL